MLDVPEATRDCLACCECVVRVVAVKVERDNEIVLQHEVVRTRKLDGLLEISLPRCWKDVRVTDLRDVRKRVVLPAVWSTPAPARRLHLDHTESELILLD